MKPRVRLRLESVSPVSWGGYNGSSDPIIVRILSIRGTMRRWYRWYLASTRCQEPDLKTLIKREKEVFGGVHGSPLASKVRLWFDSLEVLEELRLSGRDPFLWPLRKKERKFYMIRYDLLLEASSNEILCEGLKALALNLTLGGFGYRSSRGYGSFKIVNFSLEGASQGCIGDILELARDLSNSPNPGLWIEKMEEFLRIMGVEPCPSDELWEIQNLSNMYLVTLSGGWGWKETLKELERRIKIVERGLRARRPGDADFRVLLGSPILDPFGRRPYRWHARRASPLILGLSGKGGRAFVRGVLLISRDYPLSRNKYENILGHLGNRLEEGFRRVREKLEEEGFRVGRFEG